MTKNFLTAAAMGMMLITGMAGCAGETPQIETEMPQEEREAQIVPEMQATQKSQKESTGENAGEPAEEDSKPESAGAENTEDSEGSAEAVKEEEEPKRIMSAQEGTEFLPGKVQSVGTDSMVVAQTTIKGEGEEASIITLVDEKDAEKITVMFTADTKVEHWIIQGGGAGIDMQDASFSDLAPGQGVEIEGYYEGENFVAVKILIEEYE